MSRKIRTLQELLLNQIYLLFKIKCMYQVILLTVLFVGGLFNSTTAQSKAPLPKVQEMGGEKKMSDSSKKDAAHKIIFQLASGDSLVWKGLINNIKHIKEGWGDDVQMAIVAHGPGIEFLMKEKTTEQKAIAKYTALGIEFIACENTMKNKKITKEAIISEATYVVMGIGEVVIRQEKGWSYIKAGF